MPALPDGDPAPADGRLPEGLDWGRPLRAYVHVPFCATRCGYCDFNTYTAGELGGFDTAGFVRAVQAEIALAAQVGQVRPLASVFLGGGTPSLLPADDLAALLTSLTSTYTLADGAEVTMEVNPENVTQEALEAWLRAGVTRVSIGMQSADPGALRILQRVHTPGAAVRAATMASAAGFRHVSLDLIYGVPGQSDRSWAETVQAALSAEPDHISAYALGVEPGTALFRQVARGEVAQPDTDAAARQYELADDLLATNGYRWYEISNWSLPGGQCEHNLGYWRGDNWWGFGPGAHSHVDGVRWWNRKRPAAYADALTAGTSPAVGREILDDEQRRIEDVMLRVRLADGFPADQPVAESLLRDGLVERAEVGLVLTRRGRLLADAVTRIMLGWDQS